MAIENKQAESMAPKFPLSVLIVEDNPDDAEPCLRALERRQFEVEFDIVKTQAEFTARLRTATFDATT